MDYDTKRSYHVVQEGVFGVQLYFSTNEAHKLILISKQWLFNQATVAQCNGKKEAITEQQRAHPKESADIVDIQSYSCRRQRNNAHDTKHPLLLPRSCP